MVTCIIATTVPSLAVIAIARFIAGVVSAVPSIVVAGSIEDIYNVHARVWLIFLWANVGLGALAIGPIYSTWISYTLGW